MHREFGANLIATYLLAWLVVFLFSQVSRHELQLRFVLTTLSTLIVIVGFEALSVFGIVDYGVFFQQDSRRPWSHSDKVSDEELLYRRKSHLERSGRLPGNIAASWCLPERNLRTYPYHVRYDQDGFRNAEREPGALAVLGDSFVEAVIIPAEENLTGQLSSLTGTQVVNLGMSGYGPQQELVVLQRFLPAETRLVVWAFYEGNDLENLVSYDAQRASLRAGSTVRQRSLVINALQGLFEAIYGCSRNPKADGRSADFLSGEGKFGTMYFMDRPLTTDLQDISRIPLLREVLLRAHQITSERGIRLVIVFVPAKFRIYRDMLQLPFNSELSGWQAGDFASRLEAEVRSISAEIGFVDLTPAFASAARQGPLLYYLDDVHWTNDGHKLAAETLFDSLVESGWWAPSAATADEGEGVPSADGG